MMSEFRVNPHHANWDIFFFYGKSELDLECRFDLYELLLQNKRSLFYGRRLSAGVNTFENMPNSIELQVLGRFDIASAVAYRNSVVSAGSGGSVDRRIAVSQYSISFLAKDGNLDVNILYFLFSDYETPRNDSFPLGG